MKNIHILPTDKPSRIYMNLGQLFLEQEYSISKGESLNHNIYITSDEEIKEGDWVYNIVSKTKFKATKQLIDLINDPNVALTTNKKIILTTDPDLIKDGVQAIDDEFLEWFVKNPSCEEVEVTYGVLKPFQSEDKGYLIHCPDNEVLEEPKQDLEKEMFELEQELNIPSNLRWHNSKPKQETLEEFAKRQTKLGKYQDQESAIICSIRLGAKWQQERMYSEEDMKEAFIEGYKQRAEKSDLIFDNASRMYAIHLFEQYKKKYDDK